MAEKFVPRNQNIDYYGDDAENYNTHRPSYPQGLFDRLKQEVTPDGKRQLAVDVACGSAQATRGIVESFENVYAVDMSSGQLEMAKRVLAPFEHVQYHVANAEQLETVVAPGSCDLIMCAEALHWLRIDTFMEQVKKALKPGGKLAILGYWVGYLKDPKLEEIWKRYMTKVEVLAPFDPTLVRNEYPIEFPFKSEQRWRFLEEKRMSIKSMIDMARTFSFNQMYQDKFGNDEDYVDPVVQLEQEWREATDQEVFDVDFPYYLILLSDEEKKMQRGLKTIHPTIHR